MSERAAKHTCKPYIARHCAVFFLVCSTSFAHFQVHLSPCPATRYFQWRSPPLNGAMLSSRLRNLRHCTSQHFRWHSSSRSGVRRIFNRMLKPPGSHYQRTCSRRSYLQQCGARSRHACTASANVELSGTCLYSRMQIFNTTSSPASVACLAGPTSMGLSPPASGACVGSGGAGPMVPCATFGCRSSHRLRIFGSGASDEPDSVAATLP